MWRFKAGTLAGALPPTSQCVSVAKQLSSWNETPNLSVSAPDPRWKRNSTCLPGSGTGQARRWVLERSGQSPAQRGPHKSSVSLFLQLLGWEAEGAERSKRLKRVSRNVYRAKKGR